MRFCRRSTGRALWILPLLLLASFAAPAPFAGAEEPPAGAVTVEVAAGSQLTAVLASVRDAAGIAFQWEADAKWTKSYTLGAPATLRGTPGELLVQLRALLFAYEVVLIPVGPADHVVWLAMDGRQTQVFARLRPVPVDLTDANLAEYEGQDGLFVTTTLVAEHVDDLASVRNLLQRVVTPQNVGSVTEVPGASALVLTDFAPVAVAAYRILRTVNAAAARATSATGSVRIVLAHVQAAEAAPMLARQVAASSGAPPGPPRPPTAGPAPQVRAGPQVTADVRTNSLLVRGTPEEVAAVKEAAALIDVPVERVAAEERVLRVKDLDVQETANALTVLIAASAADWPDRPAVVAHGGSASLLLHGAPASLQRIERLVRGMEESARAAAEPDPAEATGPEAAIRRVLETKRVSLDLDDIPLAEVLKSLARSAGVNLIVSPAVNAVQGTDASVTFQGSDLSIAAILDLILAPMGYQWRVEGQVVLIRDARGR